MIRAYAVKLSSLKIFALKLAIFSSVLGYIAIDLFLWHGPLWDVMYRKGFDSPGSPVVADVYGTRITHAQLERYVAEQNWLRGRSESSQVQRTAMLMDMVRETILMMRARYNDKNLPDFRDAAQHEAQRLASRARSSEEFDLQLKSQCLIPQQQSVSLSSPRDNFIQRIEADMKAQAVLERSIQPYCEVSDEDVTKHYELLRENLIAPAHRSAQHIFLSTLDQDIEAVRKRAENLLGQLERGEASFAELARRHSEDAASAPRGGDLGVLTADESLALPELPIFGDGALPAGKPALVQSRWGWHILLLGELCPARELSLDEVRESLRTAIRSAQQELSVRSYFDEALREGFYKKRIQIYGK